MSENKKKILVGITGGSGCGKSSVAKVFEETGYDVIDCDKVSREITKPNKPAFLEIQQNFGDKYISKEGNLLRKKLGGLVFSDAKSLDTLNNIMHTYITNAVMMAIEEATTPIVCLDAPLLLEYEMEKFCDKVIVVIADTKKRTQRIMERDSISEHDAENRIKSQNTDEFYLEKADYIVYNNSTEDKIVPQVEKIIDELKDML